MDLLREPRIVFELLKSNFALVREESTDIVLCRVCCIDAAQIDQQRAPVCPQLLNIEDSETMLGRETFYRYQRKI